MAMILRSFKDITDPPNYFQIFRFFRVQLQLFSDTTDVNHYSVLDSIGITFPYSFVYLLGGVHPSGIGHQHLQDLELCCCKSNSFPTHNQLLGCGIQNDIAYLDMILGLCFSNGPKIIVAAQERFYPGKQFLLIERFD